MYGTFFYCAALLCFLSKGVTNMEDIYEILRLYILADDDVKHHVEETLTDLISECDSPV